MTHEEVIEQLSYVDGGKRVNGEYLYKGIRKAIDALEKQIPKKPTYKEFKIILATVGEKTDGDFLCSCGSAVYSDYKFCPECGQALDWSDVE